MSTPAGWITLDSIVADYLNESEQSNAKYFKCWNLAFRGMDDCGLDFFYAIRTEILMPASNKTADLPSDYLNWTKVGVLNDSGEVVSLRHNPHLTSYAAALPTRLANIQSSEFENVYSVSSPNFYNYGGGGSHIYGVSGASNLGGFKVDSESGVIILEPAFTWSNVVLEYVASPKEGEEYHCPQVFRETIISWIAWKDNMPKNRYGDIGSSRDRRHEYFNNRRLAAAKFNPFNIEQNYIASQDNGRLCVKV